VEDFANYHLVFMFTLIFSSLIC